MLFNSTNKKEINVDLMNAVLKGLASDGGIFMPEKINKFEDSFLNNIENLSFNEIAYQTVKTFLGNSISEDKVEAITKDNYDFEPKLVKLNSDLFILELFHGPTLAFKDFGARFMAKLISIFLKEKGEKLTILAATSGDTGSAVASGFFKMDNIDVVLLYPKGRVSFIQEQQLTTIGENVRTLEVDGSFDDCQRLVKEAFNDESLRNKINLSSANSINIARLIPQSFYYIYAYSKLKELNKDIVFSIPSGNFGNLTAGLFAKEMGIPKIKFIAATNANSVVPEYLNGAEYNPRASIQTISNAMDVGNPSNFTRIQDLYRTKEEIQSRVVGYSINEEDTKDTMLNIYNQYKYISCPHTAVGIKAFENYKLTHKESVGVCLATAHPAKFKDTVEEVLNVNIEIPKRLKDCLSKKKNALSISSDYEKFKQFLISSSSI